MITRVTGSFVFYALSSSTIIFIMIDIDAVNVLKGEKFRKRGEILLLRRYDALFKGIHPSFWWGIAIIYGYALVFWIIEMSTPGFIYYTKIGGAPAAYLYGLTIGLLIVPLIVSFLWFWIPEQEEKKREMQSGKGAE